MGKEKKLREVKEDREIYYELIGMGLIFISTIILASIGKIGTGLQILFRILVGDWYFGFLLTGMVSGFLLVFKKEKFNLFTLRYNGIFLLLLSLMLLSHQNFYTFSFAYGSNSLVGMWNIYMLYLKSFQDSYIMGGGLIGGFIYQILYFLFGDIGSFLVIILVLFISFIFISNNNLFSFYHLLKRFVIKLKEIYYLIIAYFKKIDYQKKPKKKNITLLSDSDSNINMNLQNKITEDLHYGVCNLMKVLNYEILKTSFSVSYLFSEIRLALNNYDEQILKSRIKEIITGAYYMSIDKGQVLIQFENKFKDLLSLKKVLKEENENINLGFGVNNQIIDFDYKKGLHMLLSGSFNTGIKTFIKGMITGIKLLKKPIKITFVDLNKEFIELEIFDYYKDLKGLDKAFTEIVNEIERRMDLFKFLGVNSLEECNKAINLKKIDCETMDYLFLFINGLEIIYDSMNFQAIEGKIIYLAQIGQKVGISLVVINRKPNTITNLLKSTLPVKLVFKVNNIGQSYELLDNDQAIYLVGKGDFIYRYQDKSCRVQSGFITDMEYKNVIH